VRGADRARGHRLHDLLSAAIAFAPSDILDARGRRERPRRVVCDGLAPGTIIGVLLRAFEAVPRRSRPH
jgi:hypothetical protein